MKHKKFWFMAGVSMGVLSLVLVRRYYQGLAEVIAWDKKRRAALDVLACPEGHGALVVVPLPEGEGYHCPVCKKDYPVIKGIAHFIKPEELTGMNKTFARAYDWFSWGYRAFSKVAFALIGMTEEQGRREVIDRLEPKGGRVLEVSIGPGVNLPYLVGRSDVGELYGLDISLGQLMRCRDYAAQRGWNVQLDLGNAEQLPYQDNSFDGVFHIGGINFFNDKKKAIEEMIRVAKPGTRILIADETERGAQGYEKYLPGFKDSFGGQREAIQPPIDLVPDSMLERRVFDIWKGWFYCLEFRKPHNDDAG
jgi:ubiquinone/menaquinone biosynthesis C-methylase UbiE